MPKLTRYLIAATVALIPQISFSQKEKPNYMPEIHGTVRAKYEYEPSIEKGRFEVRNARLSVEGKIIPIVKYKAEIDLSDEGSIKMLDAYIKYEPQKDLNFTVGQMRVPFTIDAHRSPHRQHFVNRSFIAKQVGNVRDVGISAGWKFGEAIPVTLEGGVFNGSGLTNQKNFWTGSYNFSFKAQTMLTREWNLTLSCQRASAGEANVMMYDAGTYCDLGRWHIETEFLRKFYTRHAFRPVSALNAFASYRLPIDKGRKALSFLGRYDYMSDHSKGDKGEDGKLKLTDPERQRITGGLTLSLGNKTLQADIRLNYEQYFYKKGVTPGVSDRSKLALEFVARF